MRPQVQHFTLEWLKQILQMRIASTETVSDAKLPSSIRTASSCMVILGKGNYAPLIGADGKLTGALFQGRLAGTGIGLLFS